MLLGIGRRRSCDASKVAGVGAALYSPGALYSPVTWNLHPHNLAAEPLPDGFSRGPNEPTVEGLDGMAPFAQGPTPSAVY